MVRQREGLVLRWASWVDELDNHSLDQFEYLGALQCRDEVQFLIEAQGLPGTADDVDEIDARFEGLTVEDDRFAEHFSEQAGSGWWWRRLPSSGESQSYIFRDW